MKLDQIIEKAKGYRVGDKSGEHNLGEIMEEMRSLLEMASHALRSYEYGNAATDLAAKCADKIDATLKSPPQVDDAITRALEEGFNEAEKEGYQHGRHGLPFDGQRFEDTPFGAAYRRGYEAGEDEADPQNVK